MALSSVGDGGSQPSSSVGARSYTSEVLGHTQAPDTARVRDPRVVNSSDGGLSEKGVANLPLLLPCVSMCSASLFGVLVGWKGGLGDSLSPWAAMTPVSNATAIRPSRVGSAGTARIGSAGSSRRLPFSTPVPRAQIRVGSASSSRQLVDSGLGLHDFLLLCGNISLMRDSLRVSICTASSSPSGGGGGGGGKPSNIGASPPDEDGMPLCST